jgi:small subunit ribosomal protein S9
LSTDDNEPTPDDNGVTPDAEAASAPSDETIPEDETTRAASAAEAAAPSEEPAAPAEEAAPEPAAGPVAEEPAAAPEPAAEPEPTALEPAAAEPPAEAQPAAPGPQAEAEDEVEYEPAPREKPEIPGADLEPVFLPQEEQYLDAEAQAAAEAEAEAAAERARAEAEDDQSRPIADASIDLAAGARYTSTGKRKTAVARVILRPGGGQYVINGKSLEEFFPRETLQRMIRQPLEAVGYEARMDVVARMHGGGVSAQAGALRHGISRALIDADPNLRGELKRRGYLTRDPRVKERKKAGLKKARKRPQFSKR